MPLAISDFAVDFGLIVTFGGIGVVVGGLLIYIVVQGMGERADNRRDRLGPTGQGE
jgi:hypothetical protein